MAMYTVIGLSMDEGLAIAGVVNGDVPLADTAYATETMGYSRWAQAFNADSAEEAELLALAAWEDDPGRLLPLDSSWHAS